ncbi:MAG: hypothetical protein U1E25_03645 [Methylocystis sp.]
MRRTFATLSAALAFGAAAMTPVAPARADSAGPAIAAGIGGFALGAITGGALANPGPSVVYTSPPPVYVAPPPACWVERRPVFDEFGVVVGFQPRRICQ